MKFLIVALTIAIMVQVSVTHAPLGRTKRSEKFVRDFEKMATLGKQLIPSIESVIKATIPKIPRTNAYSKHRQLLQSCLVDITNYYTHRVGCLEITFDLLGQLTKIIESFKDANASVEAKKVFALYRESGGVALDRDWDEWSDAFDNTNFDVESQRMSEADSQKIDSIINAVC